MQMKLKKRNRRSGGKKEGEEKGATAYNNKLRVPRYESGEMPRLKKKKEREKCWVPLRRLVSFERKQIFRVLSDRTSRDGFNPGDRSREVGEKP